MKKRTFYTSSNDFRLGGQQYDNCPHKHRTPQTAARCTWWDGYPNTVVRGHEMHSPTRGAHWTEESP